MSDRPDSRTAEQRQHDMRLYGPCPSCGTARTVTALLGDDGDTTLSMACPAGCDADHVDAAELAGQNP